MRHDANKVERWPSLWDPEGRVTFSTTLTVPNL